MGHGTDTFRCGKLRSFAHQAADGSREWHGETAYFRCTRPECPECWDKPHGYADRAMQRILEGIGKDAPEGWESQLREAIIAPNLAPGSEDLLLEAAFRREKIAEFVAMSHGRIQRPGAWILHYEQPKGELWPDRCPQRPHLHLFFRDAPGRSPDERFRKPGLLEVIAGASRGRVRMCTSKPGLRDRWRTIPIVGWFGRTVPKRDPSVPAVPKPGKVRFCHTCQQERPLRDWIGVIPRQFVPEKEGSWTADFFELELLRPMFMTRGSFEEESWDARRDLWRRA